MKHKNNKALSLLLVLFFTLTCVVLPSFTAYGANNQNGDGDDGEYTVVLEEGFKRPEGTTAEAGKGKEASVSGEGWTLIHNDKEADKIGGYETSGNFGKELPSLGFGRMSGTTTESLESPEFKLQREGKISFWYKGQSISADTPSLLKVEYKAGDTWTEIAGPDITTNKAGTFEGVLPKEAVKIRLSFTKKTGNLGIDDLTVSCKNSDGTITIAEARKANKGDVVTVKGVAVFNDRNKTVHIQDETGGIAIYRSASDLNVEKGKTVKVTGKIDIFNGLVEVVPEALTDVEVSEGTLPEPKTLTIAELLKGNNDSQLVKIQKAVIDVEKKTLTQGGDVLDIYYIPSGINVSTGDTVDVTGVMGRYKDAIQIYGASCTFTKSGETPEDPNIITIAEARKLAAGTEATVKGVATFNDRNKTVHIQDETAGIAVYRSSSDLSITKGQAVKVKGKITIFNGLTEIVPTSLDDVAVSEGAMPEPKVLTIAELLKGNNDSEFVKIEKATIDVENKTLTQGEDVLTIYYIPSGINVVTGDVVNVTGVMGRYKDAIQIYGASCTFTKVEDDDTEAPVITHEPITSANINENLTITAKVTDNKTVTEVNLYFRTAGADKYTKIVMTPGEDDLYSADIYKENLGTAGLEYYIEATDGINISRVPEDGAYKVKVSDKDEQGPEVYDMVPAKGSSIGEENKPVISASLKDASGVNKDSIKLYLDGRDVTANADITAETVKYEVKEAMDDGSHKVKIHAEDILGNASDVEWTFRIGELNHYFGQLHSHTNISDGTGTLDEAYQHVIASGADYYAVTDHSNWFDNDTSASLADGSCSTAWINAHNTADKYNNPGKFTAIYGYEMTWSGSTGGWGHINTFNTPGFETRANSKMDLENYYKALQTQPQSISQLNHPGDTFGDFDDFGFYDEATDEVVNLVEVGNGEGPVRGSGYFPSYDYYTRALDKGWHVAPTNNQDNHKGNWLTSNTARTVILATENTREGLYDAIRDKSVYATEDSNLDIDYTVNGNVMGSILPEDGSKLNFKINITDDDPTTKVSIIGNGGAVVTSREFDSNDIDWEFTLDPDYSYYYVRVDQADKDIAVTAPVWVGETEKVGINSVSFDKTLVVPGDEVEVSAELYNNESFALNNIKVEFFQGNIEEDKKIGETTVEGLEALSTADAKVKWIPKYSGSYTIWAKATINIGGTDKIYTAKNTIKVVKEELVQTVVIDGYHNNGYVTGYYADNMGSLKSLLESRNTRLELNMNKITDETLKDADIFILTVPQSYDYKDKSTGEITIAKSKLDDSEISAIKKFVDNGGNLILSSLADYKDGNDEYSKHNQLNPILEQIGSQLRINDDEVVDEKENGGQTYRLYFDDFAEDDAYGLLKGVAQGEDKYSFYSGSSVYLADGADGEGVEFIVKGHDTTGTIDSDNGGDNVPIEIGKVNALGAEQLKNGAKIVASGTIFYSNFEIGSTSAEQYCNKTIMENILDWMAPVKRLPITNIADLRADNNNDGIPDLEGQEFAIEGIVTSQSEAVEPKNAFFEVIYVQDATGGICAFGVSGKKVQVGQKVRITGNVSSYQGEFEIDTSDDNVEIIDESINPVEPELLSTGDSMLPVNGGKLVRVEGKVVKMDENNLYIDDGTGISRVYVEGYIWDGIDESTKGVWDSRIKIGDTVSAIGLGSMDPEGARLRVRNTGEIVLVKAGEEIKPVITGADDITIKVGDKFDPMEGIKVIDNEDGDITSKVIVTGKVDTSKAGKYTLVYSVTDSDGNTYEFTRVITVKEDEPKKPENPDKPNKPGKPGKPDVKPLPQTGGSFRNLIIAVIAIAVIACGAVVLFTRKKEQN